MSEILRTLQPEYIQPEDWFKQQSLDLMRSNKQSGIRYSDYPLERLTLEDGVYRLGDYGRLCLPNGAWHVPHEVGETTDDQDVNNFYLAGYPLDSANRPLHPWIMDLLQPDIGVVTGRGFYRQWGANYTADPIVIRHDQIEPLVLLIKRKPKDGGQWALPGGFVNPNEPVLNAAFREAGEETFISIKDYSPSLIRVYDGPVADPRTTANAWPHTTAFVIHLDPSLSQTLPTGEFAGDSDEVDGAGWFPLNFAEDSLFGSHKLLVALACRTL